MEKKASMVFLVFLSVIFGGLTSNVYAQDNTGHEVRGTVTSQTDGEPLPGVNIILRGTSTGTATDAEGNYRLTVPESQGILIFSFIGFQTREIKIDGRTEIDVAMSPQALSGEELVVVGYGTQQRKDLTGAVSSVTAEDIENRPITGVDQALQGKIAGVHVAQNSGSPGSGVLVRIRGVGTVNNSNPLYVIDGVPTSASGINFLNPEDIQSIDVLKDASASAIYGARGANGVVLVTTKKGTPGTMQVDVSMYQGVQGVWNKIDMANAREYALLSNEARQNDGEPPLYNDPATYGNGTDWLDQAFQDAPMSNYQLSVSGGNEQTRYMLSGGYYAQEGIMNGSDYDRLTFRLNTDHQLSPKFSVGNNLSITQGIRNQIPENAEYESQSVIKSAFLMDPTVPVRFEDGSYGYSDNHPIPAPNPVAMVELNNDEYKSTRLFGNVFGEYSFLDELTFRTDFGLDLTYGNSYVFNPEYFISPNVNRSSAEVARTSENWTNWVWENTLAYKTTFSEKHEVSGLAGITAQSNSFNFVYAFRRGVPNNDPSLRYLNTATGGDIARGNGSNSALVSYIARGNYSYDDKYLLTATVRVDGSSRFGKNNRYGTFPSASAAWVTSEENFMQDISFIDRLKVRAGWGKIGNQEISDYAYASLVSGSFYYTLGSDEQAIPGSAPRSASNPDLQWETTTQTNLGVDLGLLNNRLQVTADYFYKKTSDMLLQSNIPANVGLMDPPFVNAGDVKNQGFELAVNYNNQSTIFTYDVGVNFSTVYNEVTGLGAGSNPLFGGSIRQIGFATRTDIGHPIGAFYGWKTDGIFQNQAEVDAWAEQPGAAPGDIRFADISGPEGTPDGIIDDDDRTYIGNPFPDFNFGLTANFGYQNFDMSIFLQGVYGNGIYAEYQWYTRGSGVYNLEAAMLDRWQGEGTSNDIPRLTEADPNINRRISDRFVEDGSYLRIKNLEIGYSLPNSLLNTLTLRKARIYVAARNLLTFTGYDGFDPEIGLGTYGTLGVGVDRGMYPQARTITAGINLGF